LSNERYDAGARWPPARYAAFTDYPFEIIDLGEAGRLDQRDVQRLWEMCGTAVLSSLIETER
jgi:hypothetical protein